MQLKKSKQKFQAHANSLRHVSSHTMLRAEFLSRWSESTLSGLFPAWPCSTAIRSRGMPGDGGPSSCCSQPRFGFTILAVFCPSRENPLCGCAMSLAPLQTVRNQTGTPGRAIWNSDKADLQFPSHPPPPKLIRLVRPRPLIKATRTMIVIHPMHGCIECRQLTRSSPGRGSRKRIRAT